MNFDFKNIINAISSPVLVAEPILDSKKKITDFHVTFQNEAFDKAANYVVSTSLMFSQFKTKINQDVPWFSMGIRTAEDGLKSETTYYSPVNKKWFHIEMERTDDTKFIVVTLTDITTEKHHSQKLRDAAYHDALTHLPNRNCLKDALEMAIDTARYTDTKFGILSLDIDNLKNINDIHGQAAGDALIKHSADVLRNFVRQDIELFCMGGDEFMLLIENEKSTDSIINITDTVFEAFCSTNINISGGIAIFPDDSQLDDELLRFADMAIHTAKLQGKNKFINFEINMQRQFLQKMSLQAKLTTAVLSSNFELNYQPQFDIKTGNLRGFEALIRWHDNEEGNISPATFIPVAEECGLIVPIGKWVLNTALAKLKEWQGKYKFNGIMSINVSPVQMKHDDFLPSLADILSKYDISPDSVEIEITEGVLIDNMRMAVQILAYIKNMGLRVSLDDFGTGYSSLSYLQMLPLDTLKIDKSFINNITASDGIQANITNSIINMVSKMGLDTIAEGVENASQLTLLEKFNCRIVQGYLRGKPMCAERCEAYLSGDTSAIDTISSSAVSNSRYST
ncbi:MAG: bifunctional diguanylate cyclase/phosphodiesterase [Treponema sp.]